MRYPTARPTAVQARSMEVTAVLVASRLCGAPNGGAVTTGSVAALAAAPGAYPDRAAVTVSEGRLPPWVDVGVNVLPVAPSISTPSASHWYAKLLGAGFQSPASAVRVEPTLGLP